MFRREVSKLRRTAAVFVALSAIVGLVVVSPAGAQDESDPIWLQRNPIPESEARQYEVLEVGPNGRALVSAPLGRVYGDVGDGYALIVGDDMLGICTDAPMIEIDTVVYRQPGSFVVRTQPGGATEIPMYLYEVDPELGVFDFFGQVCGGFAENGTPIPPPTAVGLGTFRVFEQPTVVPWLWDGVQPAGKYRNSVEGTFADVDGNTFDVDASARLRIGEDLDLELLELELDVVPTAG